MRNLPLFLSVFLLLVSPLATKAQAQEAVGELESCFAYYDYGKVQANLALQKITYRPGETAVLHGTLVNSNTFPLTDLVLYAHLRRLNDQTFAQNGHYLVERLTLLEDLSFLPGETKWIQAEFPVLSTYPNGEYKLQYFIFSKHGFQYGGRAFLEEDTAGTSSFSMAGGSSP